MANYRTNLSSSSYNFNDMIKRFGVVTVMNAKVYDPLSADEMRSMTAYEICKRLEAGRFLCELDTLKIANITIEGPTKTVTGGQYSNPLIKFGKSARLEMQDALGNAEAISYLSGGIVEYKNTSETITALHNGEDFAGPKTIVGDTFFIDQKTGAQVAVKIIFYQFLPDSLFNLTQDAEGDATVFDMNGDLLTTVVMIGNDGLSNKPHGLFYSIIDPNEVGEKPQYFTITKSGDNLVVKKNGTGEFTVNVDGEVADSQSGVTINKDKAALVRVLNDAEDILYEELVVNK